MYQEILDNCTQIYKEELTSEWIVLELATEETTLIIKVDTRDEDNLEISMAYEYETGNYLDHSELKLTQKIESKIHAFITDEKN